MLIAPHESILLCLDLIANEQALVAQGCAIAQHCGAAIRALHVLDERMVAAEMQRRGCSQAAAIEYLTPQARARVDTLLAAHRGEREVEVRIACGYPLTAILEEAAAHALIVMGADHQRRLGETLLGGTTTRVLRRAKQPVLVVRADHSPPFSTLVAAFALEDDEAHQALDAQVARWAHSVSQQYHATLHAVHVCQNWVPFAGTDPALAHFPTQALADARHRLNNALKDHQLASLPDHLRHVRSGDPAREIVAIQRELGAQLLVMGTVARRGLAGMLLGNTSESCLSRIEGSLLSLSQPAS
jgi:nucleotide-binding universal stress UspA family protein